jgi:hypothetical protein
MKRLSVTLSSVGAALSLLASLPASASVWLVPGAAPAFLPGSTAAAEPDLAGVVQEDKLVPFSIFGAGRALLFEGKLQARVVRSNVTGLLHFAYRIRDTRPGLNGIVQSVWVESFPTNVTPRVAADWRPDGLGQVAPRFASRSVSSGSLVRYDFDAMNDVLVGGRESRFFYLKTLAKNVKPGGKVFIRLSTGNTVALDVSQPSP